MGEKALTKQDYLNIWSYTNELTEHLYIYQNQDSLVESEQNHFAMLELLSGKFTELSSEKERSPLSQYLYLTRR